MRARNGKIARLPRSIREEINLRLERSEPGPRLLAWLNALPEVRQLVQDDFAGEPVSKHNLSEWRSGGFQDWLDRQDLQQGIGQHLARWLATISGGSKVGSE